MKIYCTLDTETYGGASKPKGIYHLGGLIHDRNGNIYASFNYLIAENYDEIEKDSYAKKNFDKYVEMVENGITTMIPTEEMAIQMVDSLLDYYNTNCLMAFNSGFDFEKTKCRELIKDREFIDTWLLACQTIGQTRRYRQFCYDNNFATPKGNCKTSAEVMWAYLTDNAEYQEEHTAFEDSLIEMQIFVWCLKYHKKIYKNVHCFDFDNFYNLIKKPLE